MERLPAKRYWSGKRGEGVGIKFLRDHVNHQSDECLIWPLSHGDGYGSCAYNGKLYRVHRLMCIMAHGEPPTSRHQAAHSCGNGRNACVNPRHLSWKTNGENQLDRRNHGTGNRGGKGSGKFSSEMDDLLRRLIELGKTQKQLADLCGVTHSTIQYRLYGGSHKTRRAKLGVRA